MIEKYIGMGLSEFWFLFCEEVEVLHGSTG